MFKKKLTKQEYDELPKYAQDSYEESGDGYALSRVEGFVTNEKLAEFRENNRTLQQQVSDLTERMSNYRPEDLEELERLRKVEQENAEKDLIERGEIETLMEQRMKPVMTAHEKALKERDEKIAQQNNHLSDLLIRDRAQALALKAGIAGEQEMSDFIRRVKSEFTVVDGKAIKMEDNEPVYGDDGAPVGLDERYVEGVKTTASYLFRQAEGSGADPRGGGRRSQQSTEHMTSSQKIAAGLEQHGLT